MKKSIIFSIILIFFALSCKKEKTPALQIKQNSDIEVILGYNLDSSEIKEVTFLDKTFILKYYPDPTPFIAGKNSGEISKLTLLAQSYIKADLLNYDIDLSSTILNYTFSTTFNGKVIEIFTEGQMITEKIKKIIEKLDTGHKVYFENIKAIYGCDTLIRNCGTICFIIK